MIKPDNVQSLSSGSQPESGAVLEPLTQRVAGSFRKVPFIDTIIMSFNSSYYSSLKYNFWGQLCIVEREI